MNYRINLVSDDPEIINQVMIFCLEYERCRVATFGLHSVPALWEGQRPDLWIVDVDDEAGFNIMKRVKEDSPSTGIILMSERERIINRVLGLELGCDDFVVKPFAPRELVLRAKRVLERRELALKSANRVKLQDFWLDLNRHMLIWNDQEIELTTKEFELLSFFARNGGIALSRRQIIQSVWGENYFGSDRVVDDLIRRIRKKTRHFEVETLYGYGYRVYS